MPPLPLAGALPFCQGAGGGWGTREVRVRVGLRVGCAVCGAGDVCGVCRVDGALGGGFFFFFCSEGSR